MEAKEEEEEEEENKKNTETYQHGEAGNRKTVDSRRGYLLW